MSTRSRIGIQEQDGTITSIYCHFDGYLKYVGHILRNHYTTEEKTRKLIVLGDMSSLGTNPIDCGYDNDSERDVNGYDTNCRCYSSRKEEDLESLKPIVSTSREDYIQLTKDGWCEYAYLFVGGQWLYYEVGNEPSFVALREE